MSWLDKMMGLPSPEEMERAAQDAPAVTSPAPQTVGVTQGVAPPDLAKIEAHIKRFERALAQNTKPERTAELESELTYWQLQKQAAQLKQGV